MSFTWWHPLHSPGCIKHFHQFTLAFHNDIRDKNPNITHCVKDCSVHPVVKSVVLWVCPCQSARTDDSLAGLVTVTFLINLSIYFTSTYSGPCSDHEDAWITETLLNICWHSFYQCRIFQCSSHTRRVKIGVLPICFPLRHNRPRIINQK